MHGQRDRSGHALFGDLLDQQAVAQWIERCAAEVFRYSRGQKALRCGFLQQGDGRLFRLIRVFRRLRHLLLREVTKQIAKHDLLFGERKVHRRLLAVVSC